MASYPGCKTDSSDTSNNGLHQWLRETSNTANRNNQGKMNVTGSVTLNKSASSTTLTDARITATSFVHFAPTTQDASTEQATGNMYWNATNGSLVINHTNNTVADRTFTYAILG